MIKLSFLILFFVALNSYSQRKDTKRFGIGFVQNKFKIKPSSFWMEWDIGTGTSTIQLDPFSRICHGTSLSANWIDSEFRMFSIRSAYHRDQGLMDGFMGTPSFNQEIGEIGIQIGGVFLGEKSRTSILFGLAPVFGVGVGKAYGSSGSIWNGAPKGYKRNNFFSLGVPISIKTAFCSGRFGVGIGLDANINPYMTYLTLKLNLIFGDIRKYSEQTHTFNIR